RRENVILKGERHIVQHDLEIHDALYDASLAFQDHVLAPLWEFLRRSGTLDDTLLIVTADHGECLGRHGLIGHGTTTHEELIHIPLIIRYPARFRPGHRE